MEMINCTMPHYVRCINPNDSKQSEHFDKVDVLEQLRCGGVMEAVRVTRAGFASRYPHRTFLERYGYIYDNN